MQVTFSALGLLAAVAMWTCGVSASPAPSLTTVTVTVTTPPPQATVTAAPPSCAYISTTTWLHGMACPQICIPASMCTPVPVACPAQLASCPPGSTPSFQPVGLRSTIGTTTQDCTATVDVFVPCHTCGCPIPGCTVCARVATPTGTTVI